VAPLGVLASRDDDEVLRSVEADIVVHGTHPRLARVEPELAKIVGAGLNVVTLTEEAGYPWNSHPDESRRLDALAKENGVSILGTGVSPGFIWDSFPSVFSLVSSTITAIKLRRRTTLSFLSDTTLSQMGIGLTESDFADAVKDGEVIGHVGSRQSLDMLGTALGWRLESFEEGLSSVVGYQGEEDDPRARDDRVCGFDQTASAVYDQGTADIALSARLGITETFDEIELVGSPARILRITPAVEAVATTQAVVANVIPAVIRAEPGLRTMLDLPLAGARLAATA
jgi:hypothetical protein